MLQHYPKRAVTIESVVQLALGITVLTFAAYYSTATRRVPDPDLADTLAIMMEGLKITGVSFLLAVAATFLRRFQTDPPLVLIWGMLLITAAIAWVLGSLVFLSSM